MAQDWDIKPRGEVCHACDTRFLDRQTYYSALIFGDEGYVRADHCEACWQKKAEENSPYSMWQGVFRLPPPAPEEALKKETAESLLRKLMEKEDDTNRNVIYILAVMLERNRILVEKDVQTRADGVMIRVYEHRASGETFVVPDPRLNLDALEPVQAQVINMLGGGKQEAAKSEAEQESEPAATAEPDSAPEPSNARETSTHA